MQIQVGGWKHSKGEYEGREFDFVTIYAISRMEQKDTQRGSAGIDMRGDPSLVESLKKIDFVGFLLCDVQTEPRATGKGQFVETVTHISVVPEKPLSAMTAPNKAAA